MKLHILLGALGLAVVGSACSGGGGGGGGGVGTASSAEDVASAIENPTGTVDEASVGDVAEAFAASASGGLKARTKASSSMDVSAQVCSGGGSANATFSGDETSGKVAVSYDECCVSGGCCISGKGTTFYSNAGSFSGCYSYDYEATCEGNSVTAAFEGCLGEDGVEIRVIEVEGSTFAVSGSYSSASGSGTLTIRGENGTFECTFTDHSGTCTAESGDEFTF